MEPIIYYLMTIGIVVGAYLIFKIVRRHSFPQIASSQWQGELNQTAYLYYQGMNASQIQAARYIEDNMLLLTTKEHGNYQRRTGVNTIPRERLWVYPEIQEIQRHARIGLLGRIEHWMHGINIHKTPGVIPYQVLYPTDESGSLHHYSVDASKSSLGQKTDIGDHQRKYQALISTHPHLTNIVLYGVSRGAATTFSALAEHQYPNIRLCVLEGVPSSISGLIKNYVGRVPGLRPVGSFFYNRTIAYFFLGHQHNIAKANQARAHVEQFPLDVPVVIVSSCKDAVVPLENSIRLALRLAVSRLPHATAGAVYFLQLDNAGHNQYTQLGTRDSERYNNFIHAVYKRHGLPYDQYYAHRGESELERANLMSASNRQMLEEQIAFWHERSSRSIIRERAFNEVVALKRRGEIDCRQLDVYAKMPLFAKPLRDDPRFCFFNTSVQKKICELKKDSSSVPLSFQMG